MPSVSHVKSKPLDHESSQSIVLSVDMLSDVDLSIQIHAHFWHLPFFSFHRSGGSPVNTAAASTNREEEEPILHHIVVTVGINSIHDRMRIIH